MSGLLERRLFYAASSLRGFPGPGSSGARLCDHPASSGRLGTRTAGTLSFRHPGCFRTGRYFPGGQVLSILQRAYRAALVDIDRQGMLSFRHPLLASTLVAEYLAGFLGIDALRIEEIDTFPDDIVPWSEPLTLWAGLLDSPLEASAMLATYAWQHAEQRISALLVSLICLGVAQIPSGIQGLPISAPPALEAAFGELLDNQPALAELARLFLSCSEQGSPELYQALFPLLMINGSEAFFALLDPERVSELLFQRLLEIINDAAQEALVKRLVRA